MIVCQCKRVSDRKIKKKITQGYFSLKGICQSTGAGCECGVCVKKIKSLLNEFLENSDEQTT